MKNKMFVYLFLGLLCLGIVSAVDTTCTAYSYVVYNDSTDYRGVNTATVNTTVMAENQSFREYNFFTPILNFTVPVNDSFTGLNLGQTYTTKWKSPINSSASFRLFNGTTLVSATNYTLVYTASGYVINFTTSNFNTTTLIYTFNRTFIKNVEDLVLSPEDIYTGGTVGDFLVQSTPTGFGDDKTFRLNPDSVGVYVNVSNWAVGWELSNRTCTTLGYGDGQCTASEHNLWAIVGLVVLCGFILYLVGSAEGGAFGSITFIVTLVIEILLIGNLINIILSSC